MPSGFPSLELASSKKAACNNSSPEQQDSGGRKKPGVSLSALRKLSPSTIFNESVPKVQGVLSAFLADRERDRITEELKRLAAARGSQSHRGWKQVARFGCEEHAGAWLHARTPRRR
jgi:hypothetical protein